MIAQNLATDAYDEPGSWGRLSEGWPSVSYTPAKFLLCTKLDIIPYGQYVVVGTEYTYPDRRQPDGTWYDYSNARIRCANAELCEKLDKVYNEIFIRCRNDIVKELNWTDQ